MKEKSGKRRRGRKKLRLELKYCFREEVEEGIAREKLESLFEENRTVLQEILEKRDSIPFFKLLKENFVSSIEKLPLPSSEKVVVVGIGGSSLGAKAIYTALKGKARAEMLFFENIDPETTASLLESTGPEDVFVLISKSGKTVETLINASLILRKFGKRLGKENLYVITGNKNSPLAQIASSTGCPLLPVPDYIAGRYSLFSPTGLLPLRLAGIDTKLLLQGAKHVMENLEDEGEELLKTALLLVEFFRQGKNILVLMPYCDALWEMVFWFRQLYAESLGKEGKGGRWGQTPVAARGTVDQHSQLQLYLDGPSDKVIFFWRVEKFRKDLLPDGELLPEGTGGKSLSELFAIQWRATRTALAQRGKPSLTLILEELDEEALGQLVVWLETLVYLIARITGVNPFDQPAVELIKKLAREYSSA